MTENMSKQATVTVKKFGDTGNKLASIQRKTLVNEKVLVIRKLVDYISRDHVAKC